MAEPASALVCVIPTGVGGGLGQQLQLHGGQDRYILPSTAEGSGRYVAGAYEWRKLPGLGHFLPEEAPDDVTAAIGQWAR